MMSTTQRPVNGAKKRETTKVRAKALITKRQEKIINQVNHLHKLIKANAIHSIFLLARERQRRDNIPLNTVFSCYSIELVLACQCFLD